MTKFRDMVKRVLKEVEYDPEYDEYYFDDGEPHAHSSTAYTTLKLDVQSHEALLKKLQELGYTKEHGYDAIFIDGNRQYILIEDALVDYEIDVDDGAEYVKSINSVSAPIVMNGKLGYYANSDQQADITGELLPEDIEEIRDRFNGGEVELAGPDYESELRSDYYHSVL